MTHGEYMCSDRRYEEHQAWLEGLDQIEPDETVYCECGEEEAVIEVHSYDGVEHYKDMMCKDCYVDYEDNICPNDGVTITEVHWLD